MAVRTICGPQRVPKSIYVTLAHKRKPGQLKLYTSVNTNTNPNTNPNPNPNPNPSLTHNPMRHCGRGSVCTEQYLNYDVQVYNSSLPENRSFSILDVRL